MADYPTDKRPWTKEDVEWIALGNTFHGPYRAKRKLVTAKRAGYAALLGTAAALIFSQIRKEKNNISGANPEKDNDLTSLILDDEKSETKSFDEEICYKTDNLSEDPEDILLARMIYGEARNCSEAEMTAVAYTVINRVNDGKEWNGSNIKDVLLKPFQYSCFNEGDPNLQKLMDPEKDLFESCLAIARKVISGEIKDPASGATHYFNPENANPGWAEKMRIIGRVGESRHVFYKEE